MAELKEVPTEELLSFQDYPTTHTSSKNMDPFAGAQISIDVSPTKQNFSSFERGDSPTQKLGDEDDTDKPPIKSFWSIAYFQQFFDVDTKDVRNRILGSIIPKKDNLLLQEIKLKPDLYGPFWISVTLVFTIAISGNIANYLQHVNTQYHWKYDFHLVSYAATTIFLYISVIPLCLWGLLKSTKNAEDLGEFGDALGGSNILELICIYGYSLFVYIPASILWTIQISWLQWALVIAAACLSGAVLLITLSSSLNASKHKLFYSAGILILHFLLAAGFMLFFFHVPQATIVGPTTPVVIPGNRTV